ncbi:MAG: D-alanine--D-alanine ligase family protein [Candidatus Gracilibacteria bacterium]
MSKLKIGIIFGGRSGEHEVSLVSASNVIKALNTDKYDVSLIGITTDGEWIFGPESLEALKKGSSDGFSHEDIIARLRKSDVVFPILHGPYGEDGTIQGLLEIAGIPYVGCGVMASSVAMDKLMTKVVWTQAGLPQVPYVGFLRKEWEADRESIIEKILNELKLPVFIKPANMGSSVGISKAKDREGLIKGIELAVMFDRRIVVEQGVDVREIELAVLGNDDVKISEPGELIVAGEFYDFNDKYVDGKSSSRVPADLTPLQKKEAQNLALKAFKAIDGAGLSRVDLFLDKKSGKFFLNEINTIPGFTSISMYPKMWQASGLSYAALIDRLVELAMERFQDKSRNKVKFESGSEWYRKK